jgi:hypothetical protein
MVSWQGTLKYESADGLRTVLGELLAGEALPERPALLDARIDKPLAQVRSLSDLPPVSPARLRALVSTGSGRFFRRNGTPLVTDAVWQGGDGAGQFALAAAVEETWVDAIGEAARSVALPIEIAPADLPTGVRQRLISPDQLRRRCRDELLGLKRLGALAAVLWVAAAATFAGRMRVERERLDREIARLEEPVAALSRAGRALDSASRMIAGLSGAEAGRRRVAATLVAISTALPDSAYVTALALDREGKGQMTLVARRSGEVMAGLARGGALPAPRLEGGIVRETTGGREWERFTVAFGAGDER